MDNGEVYAAHQAAIDATYDRAQQAENDIETLLRDARCGDWTEEHDAILARWRAALPDDGMGPWRWWWRECDDEGYHSEYATRAEALDAAYRDRNEAESDIELIEARMWNDDLFADSDIVPFADTRNHETVRNANG